MTLPTLAQAKPKNLPADIQRTGQTIGPDSRRCHGRWIRKVDLRNLDAIPLEAHNNVPAEAQQG
jgi:hypothetical protein